MERIIHFEQFYYTNYGQGMRFEGDSTHSRQMEKDLELLAANWMKLDAVEPVESVVYNDSLRSYVAALTVPCTRVGDARTSYWIHAVLPEGRHSDGFRECLSWPLDGYQRQVQTGQELEQVKVQALFRNPQEICRSYGLTGERLVQLMYMAWQTVCGQNKPSTMYFILSGEAADNYNETARNIMSLVYDILPEQRRYQADYQAWAESDIQYVRFAFRKVSGSEWQFCLNQEQAGQAVEIPEEERALMEILAVLYEKNPEQYKIVIRELYDDATESFEDFVWQYYLKCMNNGEDFLLSQEALIRSQPYLEQRAGDSEDYRRLFCQCLNHIDTKEKTINFVQTVMEKYILAAAGLAKSDYPEYTASLVRNWQLLDQLRAGSMETAKSYLEWIRKISPEYYQHFVEQGLADGRTWLLKVLGSADIHSAKELLQWMQDMVFLKRVIAYRDFVADRAEYLYCRDTTTEEERQALLPYCRNSRELQLRALSGMSYGELLQVDGESMDSETQNLWLHTIAQRLMEDDSLVSSDAEAAVLCASIVNLDNVVKLMKLKDEDEIYDRTDGPDAEDLEVITAAIWKYEEQLELSIRYILCRIAKYTANHTFEAMRYDFWTGIQPENYEKLNQLSGVSKVFKGSSHVNYYNYKLYAGYRKKCTSSYVGDWKKSDEKYFNHYIRLLQGAVQPAVTAIWQYWQGHEEADVRLVYDVLMCMMEADAVQMLLKDYADQGDAEGKRVEAFLDRERLDTAISSRKKTASVKWPEEGRVSWAAAACVGLYMGLMVNGWYMAVHLSEILHQPMLVWGGIAGIAVLSAVFMVFAQKLVRKDISVALYQIPWAGLWLFINLALSHFIGNKITAVISGVLLLAAYIWMRLKKYL